VSATITVLLKPGAKSDSITPGPDSTLSIRITSRPIEGKANAHLLKLLAKTLGVPRSRCVIVKGATSRTKVIAVEGISSSEALRRARDA
jgi:uncharacterized protein (TIGR00251 family)